MTSSFEMPQHAVKNEAIASDAAVGHVSKVIDELSLIDDEEFMELMTALYPDASQEEKHANVEQLTHYLAGDEKATLTLDFPANSHSADLLTRQLHKDVNALVELSPELSPEFKQQCELQSTSYLQQRRDAQQKLGNSRNDANQAPDGRASQAVQDKTGGVLQAQLKPNPTQQLQTQLQNTMANGIANPQNVVAIVTSLQGRNATQQSPRVKAAMQRAAATLALANLGPVAAISSPANQRALQANSSAQAQNMRNPAFATLLQQGLERNNPGMAVGHGLGAGQQDANESVQKSTAPSPFKMTPY